MSDLINNNNNINSTTSQVSHNNTIRESTNLNNDNEIIAPQPQTLLSTLANIVKNNERESMKSYKGSSRNDKFVNKEWTTNTSAVLAT
ncbi:MAG: hypothetical protein RLZZ361_792 [Cyanobacteriota bacterium]